MSMLTAKNRDSRTKALVFDIGRVLVNFSFDPFESYLQEHGLKTESREEFLRQLNFRDYETGRLSTDEFLSKTAGLLQKQSSPSEISKAWNGIFSPIPEMLAFLKEASDSFACYLLSNTNELHWNFLEENFNLSARVKHSFTSFKYGALKPDEKIYEIVETYAGKPSDDVELFFIDDLEANVIAAKERGWQGIVHKDSIETIDAARRFLQNSSP